jgi:hypothetical protein
VSDLRKEQLDVVEKELEPELELPKGFFRQLYQADDWTFIIKLHALIESALTHLIDSLFETDSVVSFLGTLDIGGGRHSKVALLQIMNQIEPDEAKVVRGLSKIRNRLVHNIRHVAFDLKAYARELDANELIDFAATTCAPYADPEKSAEKQRAKREKIKNDPKPYIWLSGLHVIAMAASRTIIARTKRETQSLEHQVAKAKAELHDRREQRLSEIAEFLREQSEASSDKDG